MPTLSFSPLHTFAIAFFIVAATARSDFLFRLTFVYVSASRRPESFRA